METDTGGGESPGASGVISRKFGPLPLWGWAVVVAGAVLVSRKLGGGGATAPTGGQSFPGPAIVPSEGEPGAKGDPGATGATGPKGDSTVPKAGYTSLLQQITDWFQQLERSTRLEFQLRDNLRKSGTTATQRAAWTAALNKVTGKTTVAGGKFTYSGSTYYQETFINKTINDLQAKLKALTA